MTGVWSLEALWLGLARPAIWCRIAATRSGDPFDWET
jgi:hypothetical protein